MKKLHDYSSPYTEVSIKVTTEASVFSLMDEIMECLSQEDELFELIKLIDNRAESVDFTKKVYNWAKEKLLKEGEISNTDLVDMSPDFVEAVVELINKSARSEVIRKVEETDDGTEGKLR